MGQAAVRGSINASRITFKVDSPSIQSATLFGEDFDEDEFREQYNRSRTIEKVQPSLDGKDLNASTIENTSTGLSTSGTEINTIELYANCLLLAINTVDSYIDENGLRPVVDELKERRWSIMLSLAIYAALT